jgi:predicted Zn-dependent protease
MSLCASSGVKTREQLLAQLDRGLFVTDFGPLSAPGAATLVAEVKGIWIEKGRAHHPVAGSLLVMPGLAGLERIVEMGCDPEVDEDGPPVIAPSLVLEGANLVRL